MKHFRKDNLKKDIISGIIVALVSIPISMGYAQVAGLPPVYGLYCSVFPILAYCLITSSPQFVFGVDATPAAMVGGALASMGIAAESAEAMKLVPPKILTLEEAIEFINDDELVEITPTDIRVRKRFLTALDRRMHARELGKIDEEEDD